MSTEADRLSDSQDNLIERVDSLNEQVKELSLSLALYLARARAEGVELARLEPDFIRLVNGSIRVVQELTRLLTAARSSGGYAQTGSPDPQALEQRLQVILDQCNSILRSLGQQDQRPQVQ